LNGSEAGDSRIGRRSNKMRLSLITLVAMAGTTTAMAVVPGQNPPDVRRYGAAEVSHVADGAAG
jgi:hypothetical protein